MFGYEPFDQIYPLFAQNWVITPENYFLFNRHIFLLTFYSTILILLRNLLDRKTLRNILLDLWISEIIKIIECISLLFKIEPRKLVLSIVKFTNFLKFRRLLLGWFFITIIYNLSFFWAHLVHSTYRFFNIWKLCLIFTYWRK